MDWSRFKNYGLWVSIFAFIPIFLQAIGIKVIPEYTEVVNAFLAILVAMGLVNNPTTKNKGYLDDKPSNKIQNTSSSTNSTNVSIVNNTDKTEK